jgi:hypothetical protein
MARSGVAPAAAHAGKGAANCARAQTKTRRSRGGGATSAGARQGGNRAGKGSENAPSASVSISPKSRVQVDTFRTLKNPLEVPQTSENCVLFVVVLFSAHPSKFVY